MKITKHVLDNRIEYRNEKGDVHRENGPAIIWNDGTKHWYQNDLYHRLNGPACEERNGDKFWYKNGQYHREDGPAMEFGSGDKIWYQNGFCHRLNAPAYIINDGYEHWWFKGKSNRFVSEKNLKKNIESYFDVKLFLVELKIEELDEQEVFLLHLTIKNHFPDHLHYLDKFLVLK